MRFLLALFLLSLLILPGVKAQETLPGFTVSLKSNGKVVVSWKNAYPAINQISIQRSTDSLRNFSTLITVPDPHTPENGFVDSRAQGKRLYYRIFILFGNSKYMFTRSKRAVPEPEPRTRPAEPKPKPAAEPPLVKTKPTPEKTKPVQARETPPEKPVVAEQKPEEPQDIGIPRIDNSRIFYLQDKRNLRAPDVNGPSKIKAPSIEVQKTLYVKRRDSLILKLSGNNVRRFSDSLLKQTKDTLLFVTADTLMIKPYLPPPVEFKDVYKVSPYVFTGRDGNVTIALADFAKKKYSVQFFEDDHTPVLEVKNINNKVLIIDKTNFSHSGWFRFELYEDGQLREKNKFFIPKEF